MGLQEAARRGRGDKEELHHLFQGQNEEDGTNKDVDTWSKRLQNKPECEWGATAC